MMTKLHTAEIFLIDLDGTVYLDTTVISGAIDTFKMLKMLDKKVCFLTNNSSKSKNDYLEKLTQMGFDICADEIYSSQDATILYLNEKHPNAKVFLVGTTALRTEFLSAGINICDDGDEDIVVLGYDTEITYEKIAKACLLLQHGAKLVATHPDMVCPSKKGGMPDAGSFLKLIEGATGIMPEIVCGKPCAYLAQALSKKFGTATNKMAMVGDRLYTDMRFALDNGMASVLVLSGETTTKAYENWGEKVDFVLRNIAEIKTVLMRR